MKKLLFIAGVASAFFMACDSDSGTGPRENNETSQLKLESFPDSLELDSAVLVITHGNQIDTLVLIPGAEASRTIPWEGGEDYTLVYHLYANGVRIATGSQSGSFQTSAQFVLNPEWDPDSIAVARGELMWLDEAAMLAAFSSLHEDSIKPLVPLLTSRAPKGLSFAWHIRDEKGASLLDSMADTLNFSPGASMKVRYFITLIAQEGARQDEVAWALDWTPKSQTVVELLPASLEEDFSFARPGSPVRIPLDSVGSFDWKVSHGGSVVAEGNGSLDWTPDSSLAGKELKIQLNGSNGEQQQSREWTIRVLELQQSKRLKDVLVWLGEDTLSADALRRYFYDPAAVERIASVAFYESSEATGDPVRVLDFEYDAQGYKTAAALSQGGVSVVDSTFAYNADGDLMVRTIKAGASVIVDSLFRTDGRLVEKRRYIDGTLNEYIRYKLLLGLPVEDSTYIVGPDGASLGRLVRYQYHRGLLTSARTFVFKGELAEMQFEEYEYNGAGELASHRIYASGFEPILKISLRWTYSPSTGLLSSFVRSNEETREIEFRETHVYENIPAAAAKASAFAMRDKPSQSYTLLLKDFITVPDEQVQNALEALP